MRSIYFSISNGTYTTVINALFVVWELSLVRQGMSFVS
jgi:hypothetical protein